MRKLLLKIKSIKFIPAELSLIVYRFGLPLIAIYAVYNLLRITTSAPEELFYIMRQCRETMEYILMSLVIITAGAAAFEYSTKIKKDGGQ